MFGNLFYYRVEFSPQSRTNATPNDLIHHTASQGDSLLKVKMKRKTDSDHFDFQGKGLCASLATILKISPAFFLSLVHRFSIIWKKKVKVFSQGWQHSCGDNHVATLCGHLHCSWTTSHFHRGL